MNTHDLVAFIHHQNMTSKRGRSAGKMPVTTRRVVTHNESNNSSSDDDCEDDNQHGEASSNKAPRGLYNMFKMCTYYIVAI